MSAITAKASRKMKKYAVLTREPRCFLGSFDFSWEQRKLGDIADIVGGGTPSTGNQSYWDGDIDWYAPAEIADQIYANSSQKKITGLGYENSSAKMLPPGTVLFTSRAGIGKTAILTRKGCTNQGFQSIVPHRGELDSYFIFSRTEELKRYGELVGAGSTFVEVSGKQMAVMELMMPPTMREQQTIGGFFQQLDHLITLHQRKCVFLFGFFQAFISMIFTASTFSWEQRKLGEIGSVSMCRRIFKEQTSETGDIPFYKIGTFGADPDAFISRELFEEYKSKYPYPQKGDILISASGSIGRAVEFAGNNEYFQDSNIVWLNHDERLSNPFLKCFYSVVKWAGIEGSTIKRLYNDNILNTVICMPSVPEQKRIGLFFENLDNLITLHQRECISFTARAGRRILTANKKRNTSSWEQRKLSEIADKVTEKNAGLQYVETFTNSAEFGIISQRDFFDHDIAKLGSLDGYYIVKNEDFVYNPRISTSAPVGPINRNKLGKTGVMSPLYTVFRPHDVDTTYLEHFFKCAYWHSFMNFNGDSGARSDRFSIKDDVFFQMPIPLPYIDEQRKIGELLTRLDHLITLHQRKPFLMKWRTSDANRNKTNRLVL